MTTTAPATPRRATAPCARRSTPPWPTPAPTPSPSSLSSFLRPPPSPPPEPVQFPPPTPITLGSALPDLSGSGDTIDGAGAGVIVDGMASGFDCFSISGDGNTISGLSLITNCSTGISITGVDNTVGGANIDNDLDDLYNEDPVDAVDNDGDTLTDEDPLEGGMVIGPNGDGVVISGAAATGNTVLGNHIGSTPQFNGWGVVMQAGADNNTIGGTTAGERNVITGNNGGVLIEDTGTTGNTVKGNYIGTDAAGATAPGPPFQPGGLRIQAGAQNNTIGGATTPGACDTDCNVISGNTVDGVAIADSGTTGNVVKANYIGT